LASGKLEYFWFRCGYLVGMSICAKLETFPCFPLKAVCYVAPLTSQFSASSATAFASVQLQPGSVCFIVSICLLIWHQFYMLWTWCRVLLPHMPHKGTSWQGGECLPQQAHAPWGT
jgi:hypothetical protein